MLNGNVHNGPFGRAIENCHIEMLCHVGAHWRWCVASSSAAKDFPSHQGTPYSDIPE